MIRPKIKEQKVLEYVEYLEKELEAFEADSTLVNFYNGLKKQVDDISKLFNEIEIDEGALKSGDDKFFDRYFKFLTQADTIYENLEKLEKKIKPIIEKMKMREDASVERHIFKKDDS